MMRFSLVPLCHMLTAAVAVFSVTGLSACGRSAAVGMPGSPAPAGAISSPTQDADAVRVGDLTIRGAFARPGTSGGTSALYFTVRNDGRADDAVIEAQSEVASAVELHETVIENERARMRPVVSIAVRAGASVELKPGGYHVMLIGLRRDLREGDRVAVQVAFERAGRVTLEAPVRSFAQGAANGQTGMGDRHQTGDQTR